ncbi:MAG: hypothetical protein FH749_11145 [Firmicutes bacterium]|nr:hypothetical protein [Bacillota bacterium]
MSQSQNATWQLQITIPGHLDQLWSRRLDLELVRTASGTTVLSGSVRDTAALYGLLTKLRDLGLEFTALEAHKKEETNR